MRNRTILAVLIGLASIAIACGGGSGNSTPTLMTAATPQSTQSVTPNASTGLGLQYPFNQIGLRSVFFLDAARGWASGYVGGENGGTILATEDGGRTWRRQFTGRSPISGLYFSTPQDGWALESPGQPGAYEKTTLLTTSDGGAHWQPISDLGAPNSLKFFPAQPGWGIAVLEPLGVAGTSGDLARTTDGGKTWMAEDIQFRVRGACFNDLDHGWITSGAQVFHLSRGPDRIADWVPVLTDSLGGQGNHNPTKIWCSGTDVAWVLFPYQSVFDPGYALYRTIDAGATWEPVLQHEFPSLSLPDSGVGFVDVAIVNRDTAFVTLFSCSRFCDDYGGRSYLLRTDTGGLSWSSPVEIPLQWGSAVSFADPVHGWAVGATEGEGSDRSKAHPAILFTSDGGVTWTPQYP